MKIKRYIMGNLSIPGCNLKCSYCFFNQMENHENARQIFDYSIEQMKEALTTERLGGNCLISLCGDGETLLEYSVVELAKALLDNGHIIDIVTNGTLTTRLHELNDILTEEEKTRCTISFSLHYLELVRINKIEEFFNNMKFMHENGFGVVYSLVLCDEYIPHVEDIKRLCMEHIGFMPSVSVVRDVNDSNKIMTKYDLEEYIAIGKSFGSPAFESQLGIVSKKQLGFCYAGDWAFILNFKTGVMQQCQANFMPQNIFENPTEQIQYIPVGNNCKMPWCVCMQFQNYGIIPEEEFLLATSMSGENTVNWGSPVVKEWVDGKLAENNRQYTQEEKELINAAYRNLGLAGPGNQG